MSRLFRPSWLPRIDEYWLRDNSSLWVSQVHRTTWYGIAVSAVLSAIMIITPFLLYSLEYLSWIVLCVVVGQLVGIFWWLHFQGLYDVAKGYEGVTTKGGLSEAWTYMVCILTICLPSIAVVAGVAINLKLWSEAVIEDDLRFLTAEADADGIRSKFGDRQYGMLPSRAMLPLLDVLGRISAEDPHGFSKSNARLQRMMDTYMGNSMLAAEIASALSAMKSDAIERPAQGVSDNSLPVSLLSGPSNFADTLLYGARRIRVLGRRECVKIVSPVFASRGGAGRCLASIRLLASARRKNSVGMQHSFLCSRRSFFIQKYEIG